MIGHFPDPYPDELLYSVCARYSERNRFPASRQMMEALFHDHLYVASVDLPSNLDALIDALPPGHRYTSDYMIDRHTLFPLYGPFLRKENYPLIRLNMKGSGRRTTDLLAGITAGGIRPPAWMRSCPACAEADQKKYGEAYWHRLHQIAGVEVCPIHKVFLQTTEVRIRNGTSRHVFVSARLAERSGRVIPLDSSNPNHAVLEKIAQDAAWILEQHGLSPGLDIIHQRYLELMTTMGYATAGGHVRIGRLRRAFLAHYPSHVLQLLQSEVPASGDPRWLARIVRKPRGIQAPVRHLLLMQFLGVNPAAFFKPDPQAPPFGTGPFPCLNRVCPHYKRPVIDGYELRHTAEHDPVGRFSCAHCGSVYDRWNTDPLTADNVVDYGKKWDEKLTVLWCDESVSLRNLSRQLGVDPRTTKRHAAELGLAFPRTVHGRISRLSYPLDPNRRIQREQARQSRRSLWLAELAANPTLTRSELRSRHPVIYSWLYRYDKTWLDSHQPPRQKRNRSTPRVNWEKRDADIAALIVQAATHLKSLPGKPKRITVNALGQVSGTYRTVTKHRDKLRLTRLALARVVESTEEFAVRRINSVRDRFLADRTLPTRSHFMYVAGVSEKARESPLVQSAVEDALQVMRETMPVAPPPQPVSRNI
ncbi:MAG: TnsD family Tn7-like transposition protein [Verrucomicrobiia bacterium]|jgi:hypothetical protein